MATTTATNNFVMRLIGAVSLDVAIYEEVEADQNATGQALIVVLLSSLAAGVGATGLEHMSLDLAVVIAMVSMGLWAAWATVTCQIGVRLMPQAQTRSDIGELLRTIGFAAAPGMLRVFGIIPGVTKPAFIISAIWMLAAMVVAVRQALDYTSTSRAIAVCVIGWSLALAIAIVIGLFLSPPVS